MKWVFRILKLKFLKYAWNFLWFIMVVHVGIRLKRPIIIKIKLDVILKFVVLVDLICSILKKLWVIHIFIIIRFWNILISHLLNLSSVWVRCDVPFSSNFLEIWRRNMIIAHSLISDSWVKHYKIGIHNELNVTAYSLGSRKRRYAGMVAYRWCHCLHNNFPYWFKVLYVDNNYISI